MFQKIAVALALGGALAGCNAVTVANNSLATLAKNDIPAACGIVKVAEGYFGAASPLVPANLRAAEATAEQAVAVICNNPPSDIAGAFATLLQEWTIIQAATKTGSN